MGNSYQSLKTINQLPFILSPPPNTRLGHFFCVLSKTSIFTCIRTCIHWTLFRTSLRVKSVVQLFLYTKYLSSSTYLIYLNCLAPTDPLWENVNSMALIRGLYCSLDTKYWWAFPPTSKNSQCQIPQNHRLLCLIINLAPKILVFLGHLSERHFWKETSHPKVCLSIHICPSLFPS